MGLKYHTSADFFYDKNGELYSNPNENLEKLEKMYCEAFLKYKIAKKKEAELLSSNMDKDDGSLLDIALSTFNFANYIESLEWKIDLKILHAANNN